MIVPAALALMFAGFAGVRSMPVDVLPEFAPPLVQIQTEALGLSAAEVEQLVTVPMEQDLLNGVAWLKEIRSDSVSGLSSIDLVFEPGTDVMRARQMVQERLTQAHALPHVSKPPVMVQPVSSTSRVAMVALSSRAQSLIDLSVLARWRIKPRLMGVPGVANVSIWGQRERQLQVLVDPNRLAQSNVTLGQILQTTGNALWVSPLTFVEASTPGTGGFVESPNQRLGIQHILPIRTANDLAQISIEETVRPLKLGDVTTVVEDHQPLIGDAVVDGGGGLMLVIEKLPGANTVEVTEGIQEALDALRPGLGDARIDSAVFRPASYIETARANAGTLLLLGLILVALLFGAFFFDWRSGVIALVAVPVSLGVAGLVLHQRGGTFNVVVLAGLVIALGAVVDDAIVGVEHVKRRLRESEERETLVRDALLEMLSPLAYATVLIAVVAAPVFVLGGLVGAFAQPLALTYLLAVAASFAVALTVTPALAFTLLGRGTRERREPPLSRALRAAYTKIIDRSVHWWAPALAVGLALLAIGLVLVPRLDDRSVLPALQDRDLLIRWTSAPGISQPEMVRITGQASAELRAIPGVRNVGVHVGRAITGDQIVGVNSGELWVSVDEKADYGATVAKVRSVVEGYPGFRHDVQTYPDERVREMLTGTNHDVVVRVYGEDLEVMYAKAEEVRQFLNRTKGVVNARVDVQPQEPTIEIEVRLGAAEKYGLKPGDVRRATATLLSGLNVGNLFEDQKVFDVVVWGDPKIRTSISDIGLLLIDTPTGQRVPLKDVADVRIRSNLANVKHSAVSRRVDVTADVRGRDLDDVNRDVRNKLKSLSFPLEHHAELLADPTTRAGVDGRLVAVAIVVAILLAFLVLQAAFGSWRLAALLFLALPVALVGGVVAAVVGGSAVTLASLVGLVAVFAVAARNGVLLVRRFQLLETEDGVAFGPDLVRQGARERAVPVLVTAFALALALVPVVVMPRLAGTELLRPMAAVMLGGLVTSTLLTLLILPALYLRFGASTPIETPEEAEPMQQQSRGRQWGAAIVALVVIVGIGVGVAFAASAWSTSTTEAEAAAGDAAHLDDIPGSPIKRVTLSPEAVKRVGVQTAPVTQSPRLTIPYAAVFYDPSGSTWTFTNPEPRVYVRTRITIESIQGDQAILTEGPPAGTQVVTVGAAVLYGTEVGVGGDE